MAIRNPSSDAKPERRSLAGCVAGPLAPFLLMGLLALGYGTWQAIDRRGYFARARHTLGTVVDVSRFSKGDYVDVRYSTPSGESVQFHSRIRWSRDRFKKGQMVPVLYDPDNFKRAEIDSDEARYDPLAMPVFGAFLVGGYLTLLLVVHLISPRLLRTPRP